MSGTLQASVVKDSASSTNNLAMDASGNVTVGNNLTVTNTVAMSSSFLRNRIINGAMAISQRTAVNTNVAVGTGTSGTFGPDRFYAYTGTASLWNILQVTTGASDFPYANRLQRIAGQTSTAAIYWRQIVESVNCTDLSGQSVVLSFYANAGANYSGGAVTAQVYTGTGTDQGATSLNTAAWTGFATPVNSTFTPTTTRTRYTFTGTIGSGIGELAISLTWSGSGTAGANDYVDITGVQLEVGTVATPFERRQYGQELLLCQRYYWKFSGTLGYTGGTGTLSAAALKTPVTMRSAPTLDSGAVFAVASGSAGTPAIFGSAAYSILSGDAVGIYNSANNWTAAQTVSLTAGFNSEL